MLVSVLLYLLYAVLYGILSFTILLFPDVTANTGIGAGIVTLSPYLAIGNIIIPMDTIFQIFDAAIYIGIAVALYRIALWIIKLIRG